MIADNYWAALMAAFLAAASSYVLIFRVISNARKGKDINFQLKVPLVAFGPPFIAILLGLGLSEIYDFSLNREVIEFSLYAYAIAFVIFTCTFEILLIMKELRS